VLLQSISYMKNWIRNRMGPQIRWWWLRCMDWGQKNTWSNNSLPAVCPLIRFVKGFKG